MALIEQDDGAEVQPFLELHRPAAAPFTGQCDLLKEKEGTEYSPCLIGTNTHLLSASVCTMSLCLPVHIRLKPVPGSPLTNPDFNYASYLFGYTQTQPAETEVPFHKPVNHMIGFLIRLLLALVGNNNGRSALRTQKIIADFYASCTFDLFLYYFLRNGRIASANKEEARQTKTDVSASGYVCCYNHLFDLPVVSQSSIPSPASVASNLRPILMTEKDWRQSAKSENWLATAQELLNKCTTLKLSVFACHYLYCILCAMHSIVDDPSIIPGPDALWLRLAGDSHSAAKVSKDKSHVASLWEGTGACHRRGDTTILQRHGMMLNVIDSISLDQLLLQASREKIRLEDGDGMREFTSGLGVFHKAAKIQYQSKPEPKPVKDYKQPIPGPLTRRDDSGHYSSLEAIQRRDDPASAYSKRPKPKSITAERSQSAASAAEDDIKRADDSDYEPESESDDGESKAKKKKKKRVEKSKPKGAAAAGKRIPRSAGHLPMFYSHAELGTILTFWKSDHYSLLLSAIKASSGQTDEDAEYEAPLLPQMEMTRIEEHVRTLLTGSVPTSHKRMKPNTAPQSKRPRRAAAKQASASFDEAKWFTALLPEISRLLLYMPLSYCRAQVEMIGTGKEMHRGRKRGNSVSRVASISEMEAVDEFSATQPLSSSSSSVAAGDGSGRTNKRAARDAVDLAVSHHLRQKLVQTIIKNGLQYHPILYQNCLREDSFRCPRIIPNGARFQLEYAAPSDMFDWRITPSCLEQEIKLANISLPSRGRDPSEYHGVLNKCPNHLHRMMNDLFFYFENASQSEAEFTLAQAHKWTMRRFQLSYRAYVFMFEEAYRQTKKRCTAPNRTELFNRERAEVQAVLTMRSESVAASTAVDVKQASGEHLSRSQRREMRLQLFEPPTTTRLSPPPMAVAFELHALTDDQLRQRIALLEYEELLSTWRCRFFAGFKPVIQCDPTEIATRNAERFNVKFDALLQAQMALVKSAAAQDIMAAMKGAKSNPTLLHFASNCSLLGITSSSIPRALSID